MARVSDDRWTKRVTEWQPREGKRSRGRQRKRWRDDIVEEAGISWAHCAQDGAGWARLAESYIQRGMN